MTEYYANWPFDQQATSNEAREMGSVKCSKSVKLTEEDFKQLLEETYKEWNTEETDDYGGSLNWQALLVIEEIYEEAFGKEEFDKFLKRIRNGN